MFADVCAFFATLGAWLQMDTYEWNNELLIQTNQGGVVKQGKLIDGMRVEASVLLSSRQPSRGTADEKYGELELESKSKSFIC